MGIGSNLLKIAEWVAIKNFYPRIVVISGEGVKGYYRKRGYEEEETFMVKDLKKYYFFIVLFLVFLLLLLLLLFTINIKILWRGSA